MRRALALPLSLLAACAALAAIVPVGCNSGEGLLRAKIIEQRSEIVGGPVSMTDIGDFLLENDQIRVGILRAIDSPGPGAFGGAIVDIDLRRPLLGYQGIHGTDTFAEAFPVANLLVPEPESLEVFVLKDGSDGEEAAIRVQGEGAFFLEALGALRSLEDLSIYFPGVRTRGHFTTDYLVHPEQRHVTIRTTFRLGDEVPQGCPKIHSCPDCEWGHSEDADGCLVCDCSGQLTLDTFAGPESVFGTILGDPATEPDAEYRAGIVAGDFVFFGNRNDVFAPGAGFDEDGAMHAAFDAGRNTFQDPLSFDFVAAAGGNISYAYFTVSNTGQPAQVNVPVITSAATAFLAAQKRCRLDSSDDDSCDRHRTFVFERHIAVGDGDVASVAEEVFRVRGTGTGELSGAVYWQQTGQPVANARLFVFTDPDPSRQWKSVEQLVEANRAARGEPGLVNAIDADVGLDLVEDGNFHARLPAGKYVVVASDRAGTTVSAPISVPMKNGRHEVIAPTLATPATLTFRVTDENGTLMPAKVTVIGVDAEGHVLEGDGRRRSYLGQSRLGSGVQDLFFTTTGTGSAHVEPGRYSIAVSRGPEYSVHWQTDLELRSGGVTHVDALLVHEIDTSGWMSADTHLHSTMSFDSGMAISDRVTALVAEGVDLAVATDHDVITDYRPTIRELGLEPHLATAVSEEITTLEQGHFIAFPLSYDKLALPNAGALDWTCMTVGEILDAARTMGDSMTPLTIVAHPRDGFLGYISQLDVDAFTLNRSLTMFESHNPTFRTASCDFDAMEVFNAKRYDLLRTATVSELVDWNRCLARIVAATNIAEVAAACPEMSPDGLARPCSESERLEVCKERNRTELAWRAVKRVIVRSDAEQAANWHYPGTDDSTEPMCDEQWWKLDSGEYAFDEVPVESRDQPCAFRAGHIDDFFRFLEHGLTVTQIGGSDSHGHDKEPGFPRTYFRMPTDSPAHLQLADAVDSLRAGHAFASYGPFVRASIDGKTYGETASVAPGKNAALLLEVMTASWFGVDRVEVYLNGEMIRWVSSEEPPTALVDIHGKVTFEVPPRDSWVVVLAMGLRDENLLWPVALDVPYGELELSRIASDAFSRIPMLAETFPPPPSIPNWSPMAPYAVTNPIYIDTDGNGQYNPPLPLPDFCPRPCDPKSDDPNQCPAGQACLDKDKVCGVHVSGNCTPHHASSLRDM